jgi:uncharacterized protein YjbJ (UPF0337 family)
MAEQDHAADQDHAAEQLKGTAKELTGKLLGDDDKVREGQAQQERAEASREAEVLEKQAEEKRQQAAGHKGEQKRRADD